MDQGETAHSTPVLRRQGDLPDQIGASNLNDAVASLLSRQDPAAAPENDHDLLQLGVEFDAAHERWRDAVEAAREPTQRHDEVLAVVKTRGHLTMADHEAAEALPGFRDATRAQEDALNVVARLSERALRMPAHSIQGLAVQARCLIPNVWPEGAFEEKAALGPHEDVDYEAVRLIIASCCAAAGVDWKGEPVSLIQRTTIIANRQTVLIEHCTVSQAIARHRKAKEAHDIAARAADKVEIRRKGGDVSEANIQELNATVVSASSVEYQAFGMLIATRPQNLDELIILLYYLSDHADEYIGIRDDIDIYGALIGAVEGIRVAGVVPAADHDLSRLSIAELENLARIAHQEQETLMSVEQTTLCYDRSKPVLTPLGTIVELEGHRFSLLGDHAVHEIARRRPVDKQETDLRLETMARHHLRSNGYIEPELLSEIVTAWGAR